jgi:LysR family glycine cleavage system transcriptional activator
MNMRLPPLSWLRAFEASARHLSFTHAAQELNLTQAAISKQIKLLEHYLREPLFQRQPRSLVLTKVGAAYLPKVRDAFERLAAGTEEVFGSRRTEMLTCRAFRVFWSVIRKSARGSFQASGLRGLRRRGSTLIFATAKANGPAFAATV